MVKNLLFKILIFFGPVSLGVVIMMLDGATVYDNNFFTYTKESDSFLAILGTVLFYLGWIFNAGFILYILFRTIFKKN